MVELVKYFSTQTLWLLQMHVFLLVMYTLLTAGTVITKYKIQQLVYSLVSTLVWASGSTMVAD